MAKLAFTITLRYNSLMRPQNKVNITWSPSFAYALGLITTDGSLSKDGRHISLTSKDKEQINNFKSCLGLSNKIGKKASGISTEKKYYILQFGDVNFYKFLVSIGLKPNKSKTLSDLKVPSRYFFDFLRGHFDGDGSCYSYWDKRWHSSFMFYLIFASASLKHIEWLRSKIEKVLSIRGHLNNSGFNKFGSSVFQLKYAKREARILMKKMYYRNEMPCLVRKRNKLNKIIKIDNIENNKFARVEKLVNSPA